MAIFRAKNTLLRERNPAFGKRDARLGIYIAIQNMKISPISKTCGMSDIAYLQFSKRADPFSGFAFFAIL
jgi:hypothetical protein